MLWLQSIVRDADRYCTNSSRPTSWARAICSFSYRGHFLAERLEGSGLGCSWSRYATLEPRVTQASTGRAPRMLCCHKKWVSPLLAAFEAPPIRFVNERDADICPDKSAPSPYCRRTLLAGYLSDPVRSLAGLRILPARAVSLSSP